MNNEEKWIEGFEEVWKDKTWMGFELGRKLFKTDPRIIEMVKRISLFYWLESRRRFVLNRPKIICLCGSTRFLEKFRDEGLRLTREGYIVLSIGICAPDSMVLAHPDSVEGREEKQKLDELHKRKIDLADEVLILNVGDYVGESTRSEIEYAKTHGKIIRYLESIDQMKGEKMSEEKGLYQKYIVTKTSGKPLDPNFECIVLRIDSGKYVDACRVGIAAFAESVRTLNKTLARDIRRRLLELSEE